MTDIVLIVSLGMIVIGGLPFAVAGICSIIETIDRGRALITEDRDREATGMGQTPAPGSPEQGSDL